MSQTVPIGRLRQNPTEYLQAVERGESFVITNHRRPIADLVPHRALRGISGTDLAARLRKVHRDENWLDELRETREAETGRDPWR